jgi:hypothetical protein
MMFSYVNIFSGPLTPDTNVQGVGNLLAWDVGSWNYTQFPNSSFSILIDMNLSEILGATDGIFQLLILNELDFFSLVGLCNRIGPGVSRIKTTRDFKFKRDSVSRGLDFLLHKNPKKCPVQYTGVINKN